MKFLKNTHLYLCLNEVFVLTPSLFQVYTNLCKVGSFTLRWIIYGVELIFSVTQ